MNTPPVSVNRRQPVLVSQPLIEVSPGELFDKITILEIKMERIVQPEKRANIRYELERLRAAERSLPGLPGPTGLKRRLKAVNEMLWQVEDAIRECERKSDFSEGFVELARRVYRCNDDRSRLKRAINDALGSRIVEEKSYASYVPEAQPRASDTEKAARGGLSAIGGGDGN